jgi:predicted NAD/FAD-binding protein
MDRVLTHPKAEYAPNRPLSIAIVGSGIAGMSAAWLLSQRHDVTLYEQDKRLGGHTNTIDVTVDDRRHPVDTGFIVYNEQNYPNLTALFHHLGVATQPTDMSFGVSLDDGNLEYASMGLRGLFAQYRNAVRPRFWMMIRDLVRFYREAPLSVAASGSISLGHYLERHGYGRAFRDDHLLPMAAAIWSAPARALLDYPAEAFIRFCDNHGLLELHERPQWRTVVGGSKSYIARLTAAYADNVRLSSGVRAIARAADSVRITDATGKCEAYDHVVIAAHADQALTLLADATPNERDLLSAFRYERNLAVLHTDAAFMPQRRNAWACWNYIGRRDANSGEKLCVTYWMNRLQNIESSRPIFVTLNPAIFPRADTILHTEDYQHPIFDHATNAAQRRLWSLQGANRTWFCGAYFGAGFHEDGLQAGLAVAESLGGVRRPWTVANESARIVVDESLRSGGPGVDRAA